MLNSRPKFYLFLSSFDVLAGTVRELIDCTSYMYVDESIVVNV